MLSADKSAQGENTAVTGQHTVEGGKRTRQKQTEARSIRGAGAKVLSGVRVEMNSLNPKKT